MRRPPPGPTLFPYTTLFRSRFAHLLEQCGFQHGGVARSLVGVVLVDVPSAELEVFEFRERNEIPDQRSAALVALAQDRKSTRLNSSHPSISYAVFCLKKKKN